MGIFGDISNDVFNNVYMAPLRRKQNAHAREQLTHAIDKAQWQSDFLQNTEHPRQQAAMKQSMFGRGLGKSTIYDQDKDRLSQQQSRQITDLANLRRDLENKRRDLHKLGQIQHGKFYADIAAEVLDTALGAFTYGMNQPNMGSAGLTGGDSGGGGSSFGGGGGGFDIGMA
jgi:hypothetical protein